MEILHQPFTLTVLIYCFLNFLLFVSLTYLFPPLLRRYDNSLGLVVLGVSRKPLIIVAALFSLNFISTRLNLSPAIYWSQRGLNAAIVITLTYWLAQLFTQSDFLSKMRVENVYWLKKKLISNYSVLKLSLNT